MNFIDLLWWLNEKKYEPWFIAWCDLVSSRFSDSMRKKWVEEDFFFSKLKYWLLLSSTISHSTDEMVALAIEYNNSLFIFCWNCQLLCALLKIN